MELEKNLQNTGDALSDKDVDMLREQARYAAAMQQLEATPPDVDSALAHLQNALHDFKPNDRSELDRYCAIAITDLEKLAAFISCFVVTRS